MAFSSITFIFMFAPVFLLFYYILPERFRNLWLFAGSLVCYYLGMPKRPEYAGLLFAGILFNYICGRKIAASERHQEKKPVGQKHTNGRSRFWLVFGILGNVACLGYFKYFNQTLPIGISFFTFQAISYLCDIYCRRCEAEHSFLSFGVYLTMFPKLTSGPLVQYSAIREAIKSRKSDFAGFAAGLETFLLGLGSKVLLADQVGGIWRQAVSIGYESISTPMAWMSIFSFGFQIYFDFLGYSFMAIGLGRMFGFELPKNFDYPYLAVSMTDFWRRWHITLGNWFKTYVYIPLGGNRNGAFFTFLNLLTVWILTGIWHGNRMNFLLWAMFLFALIMVEKAGFKRLLEKYKLVGHLYMLLAIPISWVFFAISDKEDLLCFLGRLFGKMPEATVFAGDYIKYGKQYGLWLVLCFLFSTKLPEKIWEKLKTTYVGKMLLIAIFFGAVYCLYHGLNNPFMYAQF